MSGEVDLLTSKKQVGSYRDTDFLEDMFERAELENPIVQRVSVLHAAFDVAELSAPPELALGMASRSAGGRTRRSRNRARPEQGRPVLLLEGIDSFSYSLD